LGAACLPEKNMVALPAKKKISPPQGVNTRLKPTVLSMFLKKCPFKKKIALFTSN
jgi:hypothetical protein